MTRTRRPLDDTGDDGISRLHYTVQSAVLFREPPDIVHWLQEQIIGYSGQGKLKYLRESLKYKRKFRLKMDWSNSSGETAVIRAWKCDRPEIVKRLRQSGTSMFRINILEAIREHKDVYSKLMIMDRPADELLLPELEEAIIHDANDVIDAILRRRNVIAELKLGIQGAASSVIKILSQTSTFHDQWNVAEQFRDTLREYFLDFGHSTTRKKLLYLSLKCCFLKLAAAVWQKRKLPTIDCLMEDLATLNWDSCPWAFSLLRELYRSEILHSHALAHRKRVFTRNDSLSKRSMFNESCCSPLKAALRYCNANMLKLVMKHGDVDIQGTFERLAKQMEYHITSQYTSACVVECCWKFTFCDGKQSHNSAKVVLCLLRVGFIPDIVFNDECHLIALLIDSLLETRQKRDKNVLRVVIGGCWNVNSIYTKVTLAPRRGIQTFIVTILAYAFAYKRDVLSMFLEAGADPNNCALEDDRLVLKEHMRKLPLPSLKCCCRVIIRRSISQSPGDSKARSMYLTVDKLPIPRTLTQFILLRD